MKTYSYVVDHDFGYAPNPQGGICTLVQCKFQGWSKRRNIVELAGEEDVIIGTGGQGKCSTGNGTIIYVMKVSLKIPFSRYLDDGAYRNRVDRHDEGAGNKYALVSKEFIYFGERAVDINLLPSRYRGIEKRGPWFRELVPATIGADLLVLLTRRYGMGMVGGPTCNEYGMRPPRRCRRSVAPRSKG